MHAPLRQGRGNSMQPAPSGQGFDAGTVLVSKQLVFVGHSLRIILLTYLHMM